MGEPRRDEWLERIERELAPLDASARVAWALEHLEVRPTLSSSFGAQAAVMLHLVTRHSPDVAVILIDTGYLFPETYRFIDELVDRLDLNLHVYRAGHSPAWQEARYGRLWEQGIEGLDRYNRINKVEPMRTALRDLDAGVWFAGLRRQQSRSRAAMPFATRSDDVVKIHPIADWTDRDVHRYLRGNDLPYHPLWVDGYVSIGDTHTTRPLSAELLAEETRFFGLKRECGLHDSG